MSNAITVGGKKQRAKPVRHNIQYYEDTLRTSQSLQYAKY